VASEELKNLQAIQDAATGGIGDAVYVARTILNAIAVKRKELGPEKAAVLNDQDLPMVAKCTSVLKDAAGALVELRKNAEKTAKGRSAPSG